jgi:hypothetical protein
MLKKSAEQHFQSTLHRVRTLLGRELDDDEVETVLLTLIEWRALLAAGLTPEAVVAIARQEIESGTVH